MARVKSPLARKLKRILAEQFPPPATVRVEEFEGIIGIVTSDGFRGVETLDRQKMFRNLLAEHLTREEKDQVQAIVGVTPREEQGHLAGIRF